MSNLGIYEWPELLVKGNESSEDDLEFASWAYKTRDELMPLYANIARPMPDDPTLMDQTVTQDIEGWAPRVQMLAVRAEYYLSRAFARTLDEYQKSVPKPTMAEFEVRSRSALAAYRFVRDELDGLVKRMTDRMRWAQSVRKVHQEAQG